MSPNKAVLCSRHLVIPFPRSVRTGSGCNNDSHDSVYACPSGIHESVSPFNVEFLESPHKVSVCNANGGDDCLAGDCCHEVIGGSIIEPVQPHGTNIFALTVHRMPTHCLKCAGAHTIGQN